MPLITSPSAKKPTCNTPINSLRADTPIIASALPNACHACARNNRSTKSHLTTMGLAGDYHLQRRLNGSSKVSHM